GRARAVDRGRVAVRSTGGLTMLGNPRASLAVAIALCGCLGSTVAPAAREPHPASGLDFILGTWTGTSTCVGDRPACKNETVVYRCVPMEGHPGQVRELADKILDGKRVPMGALLFDVDP